MSTAAGIYSTLFQLAHGSALDAKHLNHDTDSLREIAEALPRGSFARERLLRHAARVEAALKALECNGSNPREEREPTPMTGAALFRFYVANGLCASSTYEWEKLSPAMQERWNQLARTLRMDGSAS